MAYLLFLDESGQDHTHSPYEVLAGIAVPDFNVWKLIESLKQAEERHFGTRYSLEKEEIKGKKFLKKKVFRLASQLQAIPNDERRDLALSCLRDGKSAGRRELTALAQSKLKFVKNAFDLLGNYNCFAIASAYSAQTDQSFRRKVTTRSVLL